MLRNAYTINLNQKISSGKACVGRFDGKNHCIVAVVSSDKILVHNPYTKLKSSTGTGYDFSSISSDLNILNINQPINSIACGRLLPTQENDVLIVGTPNSVLVYDILNNTDVFYREIPDGANTVLIGEIGSLEKPLALAGGNCALQGFDHEGVDSYWTVTGDNVTTMCLCDLNQDGQNELIVGSEGNEIRIFKEDAILFDLQETDAIKCVCYLGRNCFAYALSNGTVGVYLNRDRLWRIKSKNEVVSLVAFDINGDGQPELITGWSSGKVDARCVQTGQVIYKEQLRQKVAALLVADYDQDDREELLVITANGEVRGMQCVQQADPVGSVGQADAGVHQAQEQQQRLAQLMRRKHQLGLELRSYESSGRIAEEQRFAEEEELRARARATGPGEAYGVIPAGTQLKSALLLYLGDEQVKGGVQLCLQTTNDTIIRAAAVFAEGIFKGESYLVHPTEADAASSLTIPLRPLKNLALDLHIKALVGYSGSFHYHVYELTRHLPRFSMFAVIGDSMDAPGGSALYSLNEKIPKLLWWVNRNFLISEEIRPAADQTRLSVGLRCLRTRAPLRIDLDEQAGQLRICCDSMSLAGELFQSFAADCLPGSGAGLSLNCVANFPEEQQQLRQLVGEVEQLQSVRQQLTGDLADNSSYVKALVVKAEDARLLHEFKLMRQRYLELHQLNKELIGGYRIRAQNQQTLIDCLKQVNVIIQKAANLRLGNSKQQIVQCCRNAIRQNNLNILTRIISTGES